MKKVALVFLLAVFVPSVVLAILAIRSLRDQQFVVERQQSLLYQGVADSLAKDVQGFLMEQQREFAEKVNQLQAYHEIPHLVRIFDDTIRTNWVLADVGFVVTMGGKLLAPAPNSRPEASLFCSYNGSFLNNAQREEVYWNPRNSFEPVQIEVAASNDRYDNSSTQAKSWVVNKAPQKRNIVPQQQLALNMASKSQEDLDGNLSRVAPSEADFNELVQDSNEGIVARFLDNQLNLLMWYRHPAHTNHVFGAQLSLANLKLRLGGIVRNFDASLTEEIFVAILDDKVQPAAVCHKNATPKWRHPFVATEIGEVLPHWEVAVYLMNPAQLKQSARRLTWFLGILISILVLEIALGSIQIFSELKRQETLARQKTDFVSNVSHELKTPLTSIRMFSEMLAEGRVDDPAKQRSYLNIITAEASRLTRLINNVLDFSRLERGDKKYNFQALDLCEVVRETVEMYRPHLESNCFRLELKFPQAPVPAFADRDALAQVVVNLLSNAEKYSDAAKEIVVDVERRNGNAEVRVLDRGSGVPRGSEEKIFEQFYRAHDSLSSGIQGSGLGLTLARQIARAHGGDVTYSAREGGGSCFLLKVPSSDNGNRNETQL